MMKTSVQWSALFALVLAACGGGGGGDASTSPASPAPAASGGAAGSGGTTPPSPQPPASGPVNTLAGIFVGHWYGVYVYEGPKYDASMMNAGGMVLDFSKEAPGKISALGRTDLLARGSEYLGPSELLKINLGVGLVGDFLSDNNLQLRGTGEHLFDGSVTGRYAPQTQALQLEGAGPRDRGADGMTPYGSGGYHQFAPEGFYVPMAVVKAELHPLGASSPAGFEIQVSDTKMSWPAVPGVQHWMVSIMAQKGFDLIRQADWERSPLDYANAVPLPFDYSPDKFVEKLMFPAATTEMKLPDGLEPATNYIVAVTGFKGSDRRYIPPVVAYSSKLLSRP